MVTGKGGTLDESAYLPPGRTTFGDIDVTLGSSDYYVMGDNRPFSLDSRSFGPVARHDIVGRTAVRAWPLTKFDIYRKVSIPVTAATAP